MFRLKLEFCMHGGVYKSAKVPFFKVFFFFLAFVVRLFVWSETSGKLLFIRKILVEAGMDSDTVS